MKVLVGNLSTKKKKSIGISLIIIAIIWLFYAQTKDPIVMNSIAQPVGVVTATLSDLPEYYSSIGTVVPFNSVLVQSRVDGFLTAVHFSEGKMVKEGDLLVEIDPRPFEIQLKQAEATLARDMALLKEAKLDLARYKRLIKEESVSLQQLQAKESLVGQYDAAVMADQATIADAKLQLTYSRVTAPASGRLGIKSVDVGDVIRSSDTSGIVRITQSDPSYVVFTIVEKKIPDVLDAMRDSHYFGTDEDKAGSPKNELLDSSISDTRIQKKSQLHDLSNLIVEAWDQQNTRILSTGRLLTLDNQIDTATGTVKAKALFENSDNRLFPNQFVNVKLLVRNLKNKLIVPSSAVQRSNSGFFVIVVQPQTPDNEGKALSEAKKNELVKKQLANATEKTTNSTQTQKVVHYGNATIKNVKLGYSTDSLTVIEEGISSQDIVVIDGVDRLREGSLVSYTTQVQE